MNIELPKSFTMNNERGKTVAWIENGILKLKREASFRKAICELTYQMKGRNICFYCKKDFLNDQMTVDHMIPQERGGPTITNNLVPSCKKCNNAKANMTTEQYLKYLMLEGQEKKQYLNNFREYAEQMRSFEMPELPKEWLTKKEITEIIAVIDFTQEYKQNKYKKIKLFYDQYGHLQKPIIVDKNNFLLDGFITILFANDNDLKKIPVIVLDNVEVII